MARASNRPIYGIVMMLISMSCIAIVDALGKRVIATMPQLEVVGLYFLIIWILSLLYAYANSVPVRVLVRTEAPFLQLARGMMLVCSLSLLFIALKYLPLAEATVISFTSPLWVVAFSAPFLGEKVGWQRWAAVGAGLIGAAIVMRPGTEIFQWMALLPLIGAMFFAGYTIITRMLAGRDRFETTLFYSFLVGSTVVLGAAYVVGWQEPTFAEWIQLAGMGALGMVAHLTMLQSLESADASLVAPFNYVRIIWAVGWGTSGLGQRRAWRPSLAVGLSSRADCSFCGGKRGMKKSSE